MNRAYWIVSIGFGSCLLDRAYSDNARDLACLGQRPDELLFNKCSIRICVSSGITVLIKWFMAINGIHGSN